MQNTNNFTGKVVSFGEIMLRLSPKGYYRLFQNDEMVASFGGAEANVAVSLANYGLPVSLVSKVPDNALGEGVIECLRHFGVDTSFVVKGGDRLGVYYLEKGANQRGSICIYDRADSSFSQAQERDFHWDDIFRDTKWFHFTGITPALSENVLEICEQACVAAKKRGIIVSCDLNYRSKLWSKEDACKGMTRLCKYVDVCIANEEDAKNVFGIQADNTDVYTGKINKYGYEDVAKKLVDMFKFNYVAFTLRSSFSATVNKWAGVLYDGKSLYFSRDYQIDHIVDRVGGGDSFAAGLIYSMISGYNLQDSIEFAVAASALKHSIEGDFNRVSVSEIRKLMFGDASGRVQR